MGAAHLGRRASGAPDMTAASSASALWERCGRGQVPCAFPPPSAAPPVAPSCVHGSRLAGLLEDHILVCNE